jgi:hypothetical protein
MTRRETKGKRTKARGWNAPSKGERPAKPRAAFAGAPPAIQSALEAEGAIAGAAIGAFAGPVGAVAGLALGAAAGALAGHVLAAEQRRAVRHDDVLDHEIGVVGGDLGGAAPNQPVAQVAAYSVGSSGAAGPSHGTSEGPIQDVDD